MNVDDDATDEAVDATETTERAPSVGPAVDQIEVNGDRRALSPGTSLRDLLVELGLAGQRVAVAVNRAVVPRSRFAQTTLASGDHVEILEAVGGG